MGARDVGAVQSPVQHHRRYFGNVDDLLERERQRLKLQFQDAKIPAPTPGSGPAPLEPKNPAGTVVNVTVNGGYSGDCR